MPRKTGAVEQYVEWLPHEWREHASCKNPKYPQEWWFPKPGGNHYADARRVCRELCPVREECEAYAVRMRMEDGMWGGWTPAELENIRMGRHPHAKKARKKLREGEVVADEIRSDGGKVRFG